MPEDDTERRLELLLRRVERIESRLGMPVFDRPRGPGTWSDAFVPPEPEEAPLPEPTYVAEVDEEEHWLRIRLVDDEGNAVPGERYRVELPDGTVIEGVLDDGGRARINDIDDPGNAIVTFPDADEERIA